MPKDTTIKAAILRVLATHGAQSVAQLYHRFPHAGGKKALQSRMDSMVKKREVKNMGKHECETCRSKAVRFKVTAQGRQYLKDIR